MTTNLADRTYVRYDSLDHKGPEDEALHTETIKKMVDVVVNGDNKAHGHSYPVTHARTLGVIKGKVIVPDDLPKHLKQGPFAKGGEFGVVLRYSVTNHNVTADPRRNIGRAISIKIFDVPGARFPEGEGNLTQDFTFSSQTPAAELADSKTSLEIISLLAKVDTDPLGVQKIIMARPDVALQTASFFQKKRRVETMEFYSQFAYRFGDYAAKHGLFPATEAQLKIGEKLFTDQEGSAEELQNWLKEYFSEHEAVYDWKFQLCENIEHQPTEYAGKLWDANKYPFQTVAKLVFPKQDPVNQEMIKFWYDNMRINAWRGSKDLEPLGSSCRVRRAAYPVAQSLRTSLNNSTFIDVQKLEDLPGPLPEGAKPKPRGTVQTPKGKGPVAMVSRVFANSWSGLLNFIKALFGR